MKPAIDEREKLDPEAGSVEPGYDAWKRDKIERGLAESRNRAAMIPIDEVWRDLSLER